MSKEPTSLGRHGDDIPNEEEAGQEDIEDHEEATEEVFVQNPNASESEVVHVFI